MYLYAAMHNGMLVGADGEWSESTEFADATVEAVAAHPDRPQRAFVGTFAEGLHRTTDGGQEWNRVGTTAIDPREPAEQTARRGLEEGAVSVMAVAINPADPDEVWVGTEPSAVFRSRDAGKTWELVDDLSGMTSVSEWAFPPRPFTHHVRWLAVDPADPERIYVAIEAGALLVSPDGGAEWIERPPGSRRDNHALATHRDAPGRVYSAAGDGYAESNTWGEQWIHPQSGLDHRYVWSVAVDPGDPDRVFLSSAHGPRQAHNADRADAHVYRSGGDPENREWSRLENTGLPTGRGVTRPVLAGGRSAGTIYALSNAGLYRSEAAGDEWVEMPTPWPDRFGTTTARGLAVV